MIYSLAVRIIFDRLQSLITTYRTVTKLTPSNLLTIVYFCFSCGTHCKTQKGLENRVKSRPKCLHDLGMSRAESLGLSPSFSSAQLINYHSFRFKTDPNLASKRSVEVMLQNENSLEAASFMPEDSPSKSCKGSWASSILQSAVNSSVLVEHRCETKKIDMVFDDNEAIRPLPDLLIDKLPAEEPAAPALSLFQI
jgi:hypothetical protein